MKKLERNSPAEEKALKAAMAADPDIWEAAEAEFASARLSSRSGLVESRATGIPVSSSTRRIYFTALAGNSAQERAIGGL